jgi:hypothetical protein
MQLNLNYMATDGNFALRHPGNKWGILTQF